MLVRPELRALRSDDAPQRRTHRRMAALLDSWRAQPAVARIEQQFQRYRQGEPLAALAELAALFAPQGSAARALASSLLDPLTAMIAGDPLAQSPLRHASNELGAMVVLFEGEGAVLVLQTVEGFVQAGLKTPQSAMFTPGDNHETILAGRAEATLVTLLRERPDQAELTCENVAFGTGDVLFRDGARHCLHLRKVEGTLVLLKLQRRPRSGGLTRQFALSDGRFLQQAAAASRESRLELSTALLGRMQRTDAAPLLAAMAEEDAGASLRWQALRECLGLDTAIGFSALCRIAARATDPLAAPAGVMRAQLLEAHPELAGLAECPA